MMLFKLTREERPTSEEEQGHEETMARQARERSQSQEDERRVQ